MLRRAFISIQFYSPAGQVTPSSVSISIHDDTGNFGSYQFARPNFHVTLVFMVLQPNKTVLHTP